MSISALLLLAFVTAPPAPDRSAVTVPGGAAVLAEQGGERGPSADDEPASPPPGPVALERVTLRDPGLSNLVSHTLLAPEGWRVEGGQSWRPAAFRDFVRLDLRVSADDGRALAVYPGGFFEDSDIYEVIAAMGGVSTRPPPGQVLTNGLIHRPCPESASEYVAKVVIPENRPEARRVRVRGTTPLPALAEQLRQAMAPVLESMRRGDEQLRQMGAVFESSMDFVAERVRVTYREGERDFEEDVWVLGSVNRRAESMQGTVVHQVHWNMADSRGARARVGELDAARPLLEALSLSIRQDPRYTAVVMDLQHRVNMQQLDALARRGEIARRGREEAWRIHEEGVREREASNDRMQTAVIDTIRDVDVFTDLDGSAVKLPSLYSHVYSDGEGRFLLTNEPTFDPNDGARERWERIDPQR